MKIEELLCLGNKTVHKDQTKLLLAVLLNMNPLELSLHLNDIVDIEIETKFKDNMLLKIPTSMDLIFMLIKEF